MALEIFDKADYGKLISWVPSEEELMQFAGPAFSFPLTPEQLDKSLNDSNRYAYKVINTRSNAVIGHAEIYFATDTAYLGRILIGDKEQRGRGIGQQLIKALLDIVFADPNKDLVELNVFDWNIPAIKCYEKCGFVINQAKVKERHINRLTWRAVNMFFERLQREKLRLNNGPSDS